MLATVLSIIASLLSIAGPIFLWWWQKKMLEEKAKQFRREIRESDARHRVELEEKYRQYYREMNDRLDEVEPKIQAEIERMRRGE